MKTACVVLSGCGYLDGAEVSEAVLSLYFLNVVGFSTRCFAPDRTQLHTMNHLGASESKGERNVLHEAARIARGKIAPLSEAKASDFDALMLPGGFGVAKNLSNFISEGPDGKLDGEFDRLIGEMLAAKKPIGAVCIAPAVLALALHKHGIRSQLTIGNDADTAAAIEKLGSDHVDCTVEESTVDEVNRIATAPAYMYGEANIADVGAGIQKVVKQLARWCS
jgi:enhancing lycopene biosynthesis protein 2